MYIAIIFCIYITNIFICTSKSGFQSKYPILYNVIILFFTIILFVLFFIFAFKGYKLYSYILNKVVTYISNIVNNIIKSILKTNGVNPQGWGYQQPYGNQPSGPQQSQGPNGPQGPNGGQGSSGLHVQKKDSKSFCGEDECYTGPDSLDKCLDSFSKKTVLRIVELEKRIFEAKKNRGWRTKYPDFKKNSNIGIMSKTPYDYTPHELDALIRLIKRNKGEYIIYKPWESKFECINRETFISRTGWSIQTGSILYWDLTKNRWDSLNNLNLLEVMKMYGLM